MEDNTVYKRVSYVIIVLLVVPTGVAADCRTGFIGHLESCYKLFPITATWMQAKLYCHAFDSELLIIETPEEELFIESILKQGSQRYWTDGSDLIEENQWKWASTGERLRFTKWEHEVPMNHNDNCLEIKNSASVTWNDAKCNKKNLFICEMTSTQPTIKTTGNAVTIRHQTTQLPRTTAEVSWGTTQITRNNTEVKGDSVKYTEETTKATPEIEGEISEITGNFNDINTQNKEDNTKFTEHTTENSIRTETTLTTNFNADPERFNSNPEEYKPKPLGYNAKVPGYNTETTGSSAEAKEYNTKTKGNNKEVKPLFAFENN